MPDHKRGKTKKPVTKGHVKVPVVMQLEAVECGAASLAMILAYYDKWIPLEQVRADCGVSRDGSNARNVLRAARSYGLKAQGYRYEPEVLQKEGKFPCIIHWNFNHFVVLDGFGRNKAYLNDPARGSYTVSMEAFNRSFTGICMMFEPTDSFEPGGKQRSVLAFARKRLQGATAAIVFVILTTLITALIGAISPGFSRVFLDRLLTGQNPGWAEPFLLAFGALCIIQVIVAWIQTIYSLRLNGKMAVVGSSSYMWHVLRLPMEFFSQRLAGDIQARQGSSAGVAESLINTFVPLVLNSIMMIFYLIVMLRYSVILSLFGIASVVLNYFMSRYISHKRVNLTRVQMRDEAVLASATVSGVEMMETIKASGAENGYFRRWAGYQASVNTQKEKYSRMNAYLGLVPSIISELANTLVLMTGVWLVVNGQFTVGMIMAFQGFLGSFTGPAMTLVNASQTIQEMRTQMEFIEDVMDYPTDVEEESAPVSENITYAKMSGELEMRHVTFGYSKLADPLIRDFNLKMKQGSRVAFVGASGCGKSTLSKLISGLYTPWEGEILFDGRTKDQIDRSVFTGSLAVVDQDIILFEDTIANNIKMWDDSIEDFEMIMAARDAQIHSDIMQRDGGYQYRMNEGGTDFSGGQRQRLEIARVLAQDPTIIILDEATSALDAKTEYEVVNAIRDRGITCIVIAHRLSTIRDCDEIIVLDHGTVVERGTHDELYAKGGAYTQLVSNE